MQKRAREWLDAHEIAWTPRRESASALRESTEPRRDRTTRQPTSGRARAAGEREGCEVCARRDLDRLWIEVTPEGKGISRVTVDVTLRLCPDHRRRLVESLGREDAGEIERPT